MEMVLRLGCALGAIESVGGGDQWTPSAISAPVWFDASDLATMFQERTGASATTPAAANSVVGSWLNKGTLGGWATAPSDAARPILRNSGALYWLEYDGNDDLLNGPSSILGLFQNISKGMLAVAAEAGAGLTRSPIWFSTNGSLTRAAITHNASGNGWNAGGRRNDADTFASTLPMGTDTATRVLRAHFDYGNSDLYFYRNGALLASNTSFQTSGNTSNTLSTSVVIGGAVGGTGYLDGKIYQVVAGNFLSSDFDTALLDAFLAAKSGVAL